MNSLMSIYTITQDDASNLIDNFVQNLSLNGFEFNFKETIHEMEQDFTNHNYEKWKSITHFTTPSHHTHFSSFSSFDYY